MRTPRPYQTEAAQWLAARKWGYLGDDMGLGKTYSTTLAMDEVMARDVWVITKASLLYNWRDELAHSWIGGAVVHTTNDPPPRGRVIMSYHRLCTVRVPADLKLDALVLDEAHMLKSPTTDRTSKVYGPGGIAEKARHVWALSGTPFRTNPADIAPFGVLASAGNPLAPRTYDDWQAAFTQWTKVFIGRDWAGRPAWTMVPSGVANAAALRRLMAPWFLRRTKAQVAPELPPVTWGSLVVDAKVGAEYEQALTGAPTNELLDAAKRWGSDKSAAEFGASKAAAWAASHDWENPAKVVIFAHHLSVLDKLEFLISKSAGEGQHMRIDGSTSPQQRHANVKAFQTDPRIQYAVLSLKAASEGITLTAASTVVVIESSYVPADILQAADRCCRIGQTEPVTALVVTANSKIDRAVNDSLIERVKMMQEILCKST